MAKKRAKPSKAKSKTRRPRVSTSQRSKAKFLAKLWSDPEFRAYFISNPTEAFRSQGINVPEGLTLVVLENTSDTYHVVIPVKPKHTVIPFSEGWGAKNSEPSTCDVKKTKKG